MPCTIEQCLDTCRKIGLDVSVFVYILYNDNSYVYSAKYHGIEIAKFYVYFREIYMFHNYELTRSEKDSVISSQRIVARNMRRLTMDLSISQLSGYLTESYKQLTKLLLEKEKQEIKDEHGCR